MSRSHRRDPLQAGRASLAAGDPLAAELLFRQALELVPDSVAAACGLAEVLEKTDREEEALALARGLTRDRPDDPDAFRCHGQLAYALNLLEEASTCLRRVLELDPDDLRSYATLDMCHRYLASWDGHQQREARILELTRETLARGGVSPVRPYEAMFYPFSAEDHLAIARSVTASHWERKRRDRERLGFRGPRTRGAKLKIGYLSPDLRGNAVAYLTRGLFGLHDRSRFEVYAYSIGFDDRSDVRRAIENDCDRFHDLHNASDETVARRIHEDGVHVLVDLAGHTWFARPSIPALRPAPIQVNWLYPGTMGGVFYDYTLGDSVVTPPGSYHHLGEAVATLPDSYLIYDHRQEIAKRPATRSEAGLPEEGTVFCAFHKRTKLDPALWDVWMRVLREVPGSCLWLNDDEAAAQSYLARETEARGVDPQRLIFQAHRPLPEYVAQHRLADLYLDAPIYNAHTTGGHAMDAGLPLLTCTGSVFSSRVATSLVRAAGLPEMASSSLEEYETRAVELGRDPAALRDLRARLEANRGRSPLYDTPRFVRHLERLYLEMWNRHERGERPGPISGG